MRHRTTSAATGPLGSRAFPAGSMLTLALGLAAAHTMLSAALSARAETQAAIDAVNFLLVPTCRLTCSSRNPSRQKWLSPKSPKPESLKVGQAIKVTYALRAGKKVASKVTAVR